MPDLFLKSDIFPSDVRARAEELLASCGGNSVGAYSDSAGVPLIRKHVAEYISRRDGVTTLPENIILQGGASEAVRVRSGSIQFLRSQVDPFRVSSITEYLIIIYFKSIISLLNEPVDGQKPGVMIPTPQYPLYSATLAEFNMGQVPYYPDEENNWALDVAELERAFLEAERNKIHPRAICIINPGNPTGGFSSENSSTGSQALQASHCIVINSPHGNLST